jgi:hypothetical protein
MQLVIKDGKVHAWCGDDRDIMDSYPEEKYDVVTWQPPPQIIKEIEVEGGEEGEEGEIEIEVIAPFSFIANLKAGELPDDPRSVAEKMADNKARYLRRRRRRYPSVQTRLQMIYRDQRDGTTTYSDAITAIHDLFPDPE